ncbi:hypothetical protein M3Y96_00544900 [Aphelenchoides besseyi]|nr:hypothetical protein M3Y96_00544900 [Aphelenchoides besseyi]
MRSFLITSVLLLLIPEPTTAQSSAAMTDSLRSSVVSLHNHFRSVVALGQAENKNGTKLPTATNMNQVVYSLTLESRAKQIVDSCDYHTSYKNGVCYNCMYYGRSDSYMPADSAWNDTIINQWFGELKSQGQDSLTISTSNYKRWTVVAWANVVEIGCAISYCANLTGASSGFKYTYLTCVYQPGGNVVGQDIYNAGPTCSKCASGRSCNSTSGLCAVGSSVSTAKPTSAPVTTRKPTTTTTAQSPPTMTDSLRLVVLNAHNTLRSIAAKGEAVNKNGTHLPNATNIYQLTYSKLVESYAIEKVNSCQWNHTHVNGTGQNLYVMASTVGYTDPAVALNNSVYRWYRELKDDGQNSLTLDYTNYNHFTEVVWANVKEIGCAVANCPKMAGLDYGANYKYTFVVCHYSPSGNVLTQKIYEAGTSCSNCPSGSTCNSDNKLCQQNGVPQIHN